MRENIDKVVQRGDALSSLEDKTNELETDAGMFRGRMSLKSNLTKFRCNSVEESDVVE